MSKIRSLLVRLRELALLAARLPLARSAASGPPRKILILGYAALGDLIFLLPMLNALRRGLPKARLVWIADSCAGMDELLPATGFGGRIYGATTSRTSKRRRHAKNSRARSTMRISTPCS